MTVAMPQMLYSAKIWVKPLSIHNQKSQQFLSKMASVQRQAALHATGVLPTTPNDILNAHVNLLSFDTAVYQVLQCCTLRLATLPNNHPLTPYIQKAVGHYLKCHHTPLHELFQAYSTKSSQD
jgi:hypothetical protein